MLENQSSRAQGKQTSISSAGMSLPRPHLQPANMQVQNDSQQSQLVPSTQNQIQKDDFRDLTNSKQSESPSTPSQSMHTLNNTLGNSVDISSTNGGLMYGKNRKVFMGGTLEGVSGMVGITPTPMLNGPVLGLGVGKDINLLNSNMGIIHDQTLATSMSAIQNHMNTTNTNTNILQSALDAQSKRTLPQIIAPLHSSFSSQLTGVLNTQEMQVPIVEPTLTSTDANLFMTKQSSSLQSKQNT